jgi:hypothetical protein
MAVMIVVGPCTWKTRPGWVCWEIDREEETDRLIGNSTLHKPTLLPSNARIRTAHDTRYPPSNHEHFQR